MRPKLNTLQARQRVALLHLRLLHDAQLFRVRENTYLILLLPCEILVKIGPLAFEIQVFRSRPLKIKK